MGQQGGQTEALWTHLDPSKPQERLHAPAGAHARSAATCHNHTEQEASDHLHLQLKTTFSVKTTFREEKKRERIIKRSALLLSICPMNAIPRCSLGGAGSCPPTQLLSGYRTLWGHICDVDGRNCASKTDMEMYYGHFITKMTNKPTAHATGGA